jgi:hypothetical protein
MANAYIGTSFKKQACIYAEEYVKSVVLLLFWLNVQREEVQKPQGLSCSVCIIVGITEL